MKKILPAVLALSVIVSPSRAIEDENLPTHQAQEWISLFDGKTLDGWKSNEKPGTFRVENNLLVVDGPRSHLFYVGPVGNHDFQNFELSLEVFTKPGSNSGVYFHTEWQEAGWPARGYEIQVNNTHKDPKRTAGVYGIKDNYDAPVPDNTWFTLFIRVKGKRITTYVDGKLISDFTEPENWTPPAGFEGRRISRGTIAIQGHDPLSVVHYRNIRIRLLP